MSTLAIITARGGSKRIPKKNIKDFWGKPMLAYAIEVALNSGIFDEVMVSTDDLEIVDVAKKYGAQVPFLRTQETANDFAGTEEVLLEVVNNYSNNGKSFENICCIYPCVPLLTAETLKEAYETFKNTDCDSLLPAVKFSFPIQRALVKNENGIVSYREPSFAEYRTQDLEPTYHDVGMFYFVKTENLLREKNLICKKTALYEMQETQVQDIDNFEDWKMAEIKYQILNNKEK